MNNYVQFGCGWCAPEEWVNFDASPTLRVERIPVLGALFHKNPHPFPPNVMYGDVIRGLPVPDQSCRGVYSSHVLEHLALFDLRKALRNVFKITCSGGICRMVLPDLEYYIKSYQSNPSHDAALEFMRMTYLGKETRSRSLIDFVKEWSGNSQHLWMWDYASLAQELSECGFKNIHRASFGDSSDRMFTLVEDPDRWQNALGIECTKD